MRSWPLGLGVSMSAGYSGTPLPRKLGLKDGQRALFLGLPDDLRWLAESASFAACTIGESAPAGSPPLDLVHVFVTRRAALERSLSDLRKTLAPAGMIWVSWPKKAAKVPTDVDENVIREIALARGLVDVKVCAVNEVWSGLKLVIPVAQRRA